MKIRHIKWWSAPDGRSLRGMVGDLLAYTVDVRGTTVIAECCIGDEPLFYKLFREGCLSRRFEDICEDHFKQFLLNIVESSVEDTGRLSNEG